MESLQRTESLHPHVALGFESTSTPTVRPVSAQALARMLDVVDYGILLVGEDHSVSFTNRGARLELDDSHPLQLSGQRLTARHWQDAALLRDALDAALRRGVQRLLTVGPDAQSKVSVAVLPADRAGGGVSPEAIVVLGKRSVCGELSTEAFARQHGLTAAELRVLKLLCEGHQATEIAQRHSVALSTVRTQISSVRDKIGAPNIGALVRCLARLPPLVNRLLLVV